MRAQFCDRMDVFSKWMESDNDREVHEQFLSLFVLFDECLNEMIKLLGYSLIRFQNTTLFHKLEKEVLKNV